MKETVCALWATVLLSGILPTESPELLEQSFFEIEHGIRARYIPAFEEEVKEELHPCLVLPRSDWVSDKTLEAKGREEFALALKKRVGIEKALRVVNDPRLKADPTIFPHKDISVRKSSWEAFRSCVLSEESIEEGFQYLLQHKDDLARLCKNKRIGVSPYAMVTAVRLESNFGRVLGHVSVVEALFTIYVYNYDGRKEMALRDLATFLSLAEEHDWDPFLVKGSWAGAFGYAQFMPGTFHEEYQDGDGDGVKDPFSHIDGVASAGRYLKVRGYQKSKERAYTGYNGSSLYGRLGVEYEEKLRKRALKSTYRSPCR